MPATFPAGPLTSGLGWTRALLGFQVELLTWCPGRHSNPPFGGFIVPVVMSRAATPVEVVPGHRESHSGIERKPFAFLPESLFGFSKEPCSFSPRNPVHVAPESPAAIVRLQGGIHIPEILLDEVFGRRA